MNSKDIQSNDDLYEYICWLAEQLRMRERKDLADKLISSSEFFYGSPSEFLHEVGCVLKDVIVSADTELDNAEKKDVTSVVHLIDKAFKKVGGA